MKKNINSQNRRQFINAAITASVGVIIGNGITSCKETLTTPINRSAPFKVILNASDPMLYTYQESPTKNLIEFYGIRDVNGLPLRVDQLIVIDQNNREKSSYFNFNEQNQLSSVIIYNGTLLEFNYIESNKVAVSITSPDGDFQLNSLYSSIGRTGIPEIELLKVSPRTNNPLTLHETPYSRINKNTRLSTGNIEVNVTKCGFPAFGKIYLDIYSKEPKQKFITTVEAYPTNKDGIYIANIPEIDIPKPVSGDIISFISNTLDSICNFTNGVNLNPQTGAAFCAWLSGNLALYAPPTAPYLPALFASCEIISTTLTTICSSQIYDIFSKITGANINEYETLMDFIIKKTNESIKEIIVFPRAIGLPKDIVGQYKVFPVINPSGSLSLELSNETRIRKLILDPPAPTAGQDYTIKIEIDCLPIGSYIYVQVVGTDGYNKNQSLRIDKAESTKSFLLTVPGATSGVLDKVSLSIKLPSEKKIERETTLVFK